jgi:protein-S-isoprenylcysteine O-methyltransferase Ste14
MAQARQSFIARGGLWLLGQGLFMLLAFAVPVGAGAGRILPATPAQGIGVALTLLGAALTVWGLLSLGDALTPYPRPRDGATLHREGAYRLVRHPIYSGILLGAFGWALWWLSAYGALCALLLAVFIDRKARREEQWLRNKYPEYADYARRVKRFLPGLY